MTKTIEARIQAESQIKLKSKEEKAASAEEREEAMNKKITEEIKARKAINDEILEQSKAAAAATAAENEARFRRLHEERKATIASIEAETARINEAERQRGRLSAEQRKNLTDEEWVANMPEHHLQGYLGVEDDVEDQEDESADEGEEGNDDLVGVHDDDMYNDQDAAADADNDNEDNQADGEQDDGEGEGDEEGQEEAAEEPAPQSLAQAGKPSGHLHKTSIRVDPPLTSDGKKSIEEADKALNDAKKDYDKLKEKAQDLEFKFKSAARISRHAREGKGEAEDAYYIAAKNQRKAARHAENLAREAQRAAAKQAAHDKYNEVISAANNAASATAKKPDGPAAKTDPAKAEAKAQTEAKGGETKTVKAKTLV